MTNNLIMEISHCIFLSCFINRYVNTITGLTLQFTTHFSVPRIYSIFLCWENTDKSYTQYSKYWRIQLKNKDDTTLDNTRRELSPLDGFRRATLSSVDWPVSDDCLTSLGHMHVRNTNTRTLSFLYRYVYVQKYKQTLILAIINILKTVLQWYDVPQERTGKCHLIKQSNIDWEWCRSRSNMMETNSIHHCVC